jgi:hypothetical protein
MKLSAILSASAIAASTLITFSTAAFAISQPVNISTNSELQSLQTVELSSQKVAWWWWEIFLGDAEDEDKDEKTVNKCKPKKEDCGWW